MPKIALTDLSIRALTVPNHGQVDYWDARTPGFGVRVSQGGAKTFVAKQGNRRHTLGRFPFTSLQMARSAAKRLLADKYVVPTPDLTFADALDRFLTTHCRQKNRPSTAKETERLLRRDFLPSWGRKPVGSITKSDVLTVLEGKRERPGAANHAFGAIRTFFNWCLRYDYRTTSPCAGLSLPAKTGTRSRVLTDEELAAVWRGAASAEYPYGAIVQLMILTGQRRGEIASLDNRFINRKEQTITYPPAQVKNAREHKIPYGPMTAEILDAIPRHNSTTLLFPARGLPDQPFCGFNKGKIRLDRAVPIAPWTHHDLRRTFATGLASLRVPPYIIERLLNHASGTISGVAAVYNRYHFLNEMREAMLKWEAKLAELLPSTS
jgi:integrase